MASTKQDVQSSTSVADRDKGIADTKTRFTYDQGPRIISPTDGKFVDLLSVGVRYIAHSHDTAGLFSVVEHPIPPKTLVAPLHKHTYEDEYSFVISGRMGAMLGDDVVYADAGDFVFKPRDQWHTFWNDGTGTCRVLEIIAPGGFEQYFDELCALQAAANSSLNVDEIMAPGMPGAELAAKYGLTFRPESIEKICEEHGLVYPGNKMFGERKK